MKAKVFCSECMHLQKNGDEVECRAEENLMDNWYAKNALPLKSPSVINAENDCRWFAEREKGINWVYEVYEEGEKP